MTEKQMETVNALIQLDFDATNAYEQAIKNVQEDNICMALENFRQDHERHILTLSSLVKGAGGQPPSRTQDVKGYFIEGMTALRSSFGTTQALKAMNQNESLTNKRYEEALQHNFDGEVRKAIESGYEDEKRHKEYITSALKAAEEDRLESFRSDIRRAQ